jgi:hypothetical protein
LAKWRWVVMEVLEVEAIVHPSFPTLGVTVEKTQVERVLGACHPPAAEALLNQSDLHLKLQRAELAHISMENLYYVVLAMPRSLSAEAQVIPVGVSDDFHVALVALASPLPRFPAIIAELISADRFSKIAIYEQVPI